MSTDRDIVAGESQHVVTQFDIARRVTEVSNPTSKNSNVCTMDGRKQLAQEIYATFLETGLKEEYVSIVDEFFSHAFLGNNTDNFVHVMNNTNLFLEMIVNILKPSNSLVIGPVQLACLLGDMGVETHIINNLQALIMDTMVADNDKNNVNTIKYSDFFSNNNTNYNFIYALYGMSTMDEVLFDKIIDSVSINGILYIDNGANGGELYNLGFDHIDQVHEYIKNTNRFHIYHVPSFIGKTICIRHS